MRWAALHHDWFIAGPNPKTYNPHATWLTYIDNAGGYVYDSFKVRDFAEAVGYPTEEMYLHMDVDYHNQLPWKDMAMFGNWEKNVNGVFVGLLDKTTAAYDAKLADVIINAPLSLGQGEPFDELNFEMAQSCVGGNVTYEYSRGKGSWGLLTIRSDGTNGLTRSGKIQFIPALDWQRDTIGKSKSKWWVRVTVTGSTVMPIASRAYGDDWISSVPGMNSRGWAKENPGRITCCGGTYTYDPQPPPGATARFRHQARIRGFYGTTSTRDSFLAKHLPWQGRYIWSHYLSSIVIPQIQAIGYDGVLVDNGDSYTEKITDPKDWKEHVDWRQPVRTQIANSVNDFVYRVKTAIPGAVVGTNASGHNEFTVSTELPPGFPGDFMLKEIFEDTALAGHKWDPKTYIGLTVDECAPEANPENKRCLLQYFDSVNSDLVTAAGEWHSFERANRRPIMILAAYYVAQNANTVFLYASSGNSSYARTAEIDYYKSPGSTVAQDVLIDTTNKTKSLTLTDASTFPSSGTLLIGLSELEGGHGEHVPYSSKSGNILTFTKGIYHNYSKGTVVRYVATGQQPVDKVPLSQVYRWAKWFPAMGVDVGAPIGPRDLAWRAGAQYGDPGGTKIWRRDYEKAVMLVRPGYGGDSAARFSTPSDPITIDPGVTYYPLRADGTTGPGIQTIRLRQSEGAILMRAPIP
jgi:hypothetical protein